MPSQKILEVKQQKVSVLTEKFQGACAGVIVDYKGITVENDTKLRHELREAGVEYFVAKNTLLRFAVKNANLEDLTSCLTKTTAVAVSKEDPTAAARILSKFADANEGFTVKGGFMDGEVLDADKVVAIGKLPSKQALVGQLLSVLVAPIRGLAVALNAIAEKQDA